ncbi:hypothetical protein OAO01_07355 [Oligoflexia bacterium]|nr:hypothetical protein [Oligoflexia bacterium]
MQDKVSYIDGQGKGPHLLILCEAGKHSKMAQQLFESPLTGVHTALIQFDDITARNWQDRFAALTEKLRSEKIRQASFVCFGQAGILVQNLSLISPKVVRRVVFVDTSLGFHRNWFSACLGLLLRRLPFGSWRKGFDIKPLLHRLRCPTLIVTYFDSPTYILRQAARMTKTLPTAWNVKLIGAGDVSELKSEIKVFQDIPARCPQGG